ncbi:zinc metalloprotease HtpX [Thermodesulfobacteriota bacterium]
MRPKAALCSALGWLILGMLGVVLLGLGVAVVLLLGPSVSPHVILKMYRAKPVTEYDAPALTKLVRVLSERAGLPRSPKLFHIPTRISNAVSTGSYDNAVIAVTDGLLRNLSMRELTGVLAHEVSPVRNDDCWVMGLADLVSQLVNTMSWIGLLLLFLNLPVILLGVIPVPWVFIVILILAPNIGALIQLALSRAREFEADLEAAGLTGDPRGLASALAKLERLRGNLMEGIFLPGRGVPEPSLLRTHPQTEERIRRLLDVEDELTGKPVVEPHRPVRDLDRMPGPFLHPPRWRVSRLWY